MGPALPHACTVVKHVKYLAVKSEPAVWAAHGLGPLGGGAEAGRPAAAHAVLGAAEMRDSVTP